MTQLLYAAEVFLVEVLAAGLLVFATWVAAAVRRYVGVRTAEIAQRALTEAMRRGLAAASNDPNTDPAEAAATYVEQLMPDTVQMLGATREGLIQRAKAEIASTR
jgi:hypothetical protein